MVCQTCVSSCSVIVYQKDLFSGVFPSHVTVEALLNLLFAAVVESWITMTGRCLDKAAKL